jgi:cell wall-associated NlpC family hydrolase
MARSHRPVRRPLTASRALLTLAVAGGVVFAPLPVSAAPDDPSTSREAAALVADRSRALEVVSEKVNEARERLDQQKAAATEAAAAVKEAVAALDAARDQVRTVARSAYTGSQLTAFEVMLGSESPKDLLDRVGTLDTIARYNGGVLADATDAGEQAREARKAADEAATRAAALVKQVTTEQKRLDRQVAAYKADYQRLRSEEAAARAAAQAAARAAAERASRAARPQPSRPATASSAIARSAAPAGSAGSGGSGAARTAVSTALAQVGDPYVWGAAGPSSFDCSGLTQYAYAAAGVSLPHSSGMQSQMGTAVSYSAMAPGDLLFFYSPVSHVAMYIGNGQMVHASTFGVPVRVVPVSSMPGLVSVRRVA